MEREGGREGREGGREAGREGGRKGRGRGRGQEQWERGEGAVSDGREVVRRRRFRTKSYILYHVLYQ